MENDASLQCLCQWGWWKENRHSGLDEEALNSSKVRPEGLHGRRAQSLGNLTSVPVFGVPPTIYVGLPSPLQNGALQTRPFTL